MTDRKPVTILGILYMRFTADHDRDDAEARFVRRYECKPQYAWVAQEQLWLGPCPEERVSE